MHSGLIAKRFVEPHEDSTCVISETLTLSLRFRHRCGMFISHRILLFIALPSLPEYMDFLYCTQSNVAFPCAPYVEMCLSFANEQNGADFKLASNVDNSNWEHCWTIKLHYTVKSMWMKRLIIGYDDWFSISWRVYTDLQKERQVTLDRYTHFPTKISQCMQVFKTWEKLLKIGERLLSHYQ